MRTSSELQRLEQTSDATRSQGFFTLAAEQVSIHGKKYELYYEHEYEEMWTSAERSTPHKDETF